jgi:protein LTV1
MKRQYQEEEDDGEEPSCPDEEDIDETLELITSREDFDAIVNEFLHDYEILGRKMKPKLEGNTPTHELDTIRCTHRQDDRVKIKHDDDDENQYFIAVDDVATEDRWDCESILSTYPCQSTG